MTITFTSKPKRADTVESQHLPDGSGLLFDPSTAIAYPVSQSAMRIWELCDGEHPVTSILDGLEEHYEIDRPTLERDSLRLLNDLAERRLLADSPTTE